MKTVLLTGAGGFIGRTAIKYLLEKNYVVHAVSSKKLEEKHANLFFHKADLLDSGATAELVKTVKPSHLLHFAWFVEHGRFWNAPENLDWVKASLNLLQNFADGGGRRVVMAGTCAEYDWKIGQEKFSENGSPINPQTLYGASKHALHLILRKYAELNNLSYGWGRIFFLFGQNESRNRFIPAVIRALLKNEEAKCSHGGQIRDFMFVEDAGRAFVELLESDAQGAFNIAGGEARKMKDIAGMIGEITGKPELLRLGALPAAPDEPLTLVADTRRLCEETAFEAQTDLRAALTKTIDWWKKHL
jgi:nucleoside-diphosphate-sugar epimerase